MKVSIILVKFLFIGALFIVSNHSLYLNDVADRETFFDLYYGWLDSLFGQFSHITGYVLKSEWLPGSNESISLTG